MALDVEVLEDDVLAVDLKAACTVVAPSSFKPQVDIEASGRLKVLGVTGSHHCTVLLD
jgi:hypothetical protein